MGVERRAAPVQVLDGHPLPDPTLLEDEDFLAARKHREREKQQVQARLESWDDPTRFS